MRTLCLILLIRACLQLKCDTRKITAHIGGEFTLTCTYANNFYFNKKYWCRGASRGDCDIVVDSEKVSNDKGRSHIVDARRRGLFVKVTDLRFDDAGIYWVGIDRPYADLMTSITVIITEAPVSKPILWPLSSLVDRPTCWGQQVTVRCGSRRGTGVRYSWYQHTHHQDYLLQHSSDLLLHCGTVEEDSEYYCEASNDVSSQKSDHLSVQVLMPVDNCIYVINMEGQPIYGCADRMGTTSAETSCEVTTQVYPNIRNWSSRTNKTDLHVFFTTAWTGVPLWYSLLRWGCFALLLIVQGIIQGYIKSQRHKKYARRNRKRRRKRKVRSRMQHLVR